MTPAPGNERTSAAPDVGRIAAALGARPDRVVLRRLMQLADGEVATFALFELVIQLLNRAHGWRKVEDAFLAVGGRMTGKQQYRRKRNLDGKRLRALCEAMGPMTSGADRAAGDS